MTVDQDTYERLRDGKPADIELPAQQRPDGSIRPAPVKERQVITAKAKGTAGVTASVVAVVRTGTQWKIRLAAGEIYDRPRLLARNSGDPDQNGEPHGYLTVQVDTDDRELRRAHRLCLTDEPEPVPEDWRIRHASEVTVRAHRDERQAFIEQRDRVAGEIAKLRQIGIGKQARSQRRALERQLAEIDAARDDRGGEALAR